jgi:hypothetical protein
MSMSKAFGPLKANVVDVHEQVVGVVPATKMVCDNCAYVTKNVVLAACATPPISSRTWPPSDRARCHMLSSADLITAASESDFLLLAMSSLRVMGMMIAPPAARRDRDDPCP